MKVINVTNPNKGIFALSPYLSTTQENTKINTTPKLGLIACGMSVSVHPYQPSLLPYNCSLGKSSIAAVLVATLKRQH